MPYVKEISDTEIDIYNGAPMGLTFYAKHGYVERSVAWIQAWKEAHKPPFDPAAYKFNTYLVMEELKAVGMWDAIKQQMIADDQYEAYFSTPYLSLTNEHFRNFYAAVKETYPELDTLLEKCILEL